VRRRVVAAVSSLRARSLASVLLASASFVSCSDSTSPERLEPGAGIVYSFTPYGTGTARGLFLLSSDGTTGRRLIQSDDEQSYPSWSPDGRSLLFFHQGAEGKGASVANADGTNVRRVPGVRFIPRWSPDGAWIVSLAIDPDPAGTVGIDAVHPDGSGRRRLAPGLTGITTIRTAPSWSVGGLIAFTRDNGLGNRSESIWTVNQDGSGLMQVTTGGRDLMPIWSPSGTMLAFTQSDPGFSFFQVAVVNADGSSRQVLTTVSGKVMDFAEGWSPDGRWVLFHREDYPDDCGYYKVALSGGEPIRVSPILPHAASFEQCGGATWR
jgi:Tol biopolymer transport system component